MSNYKVSVTKSARRQGHKLPISSDDKANIIREMKELKHWSLNEHTFNYESAYGALEFKYNLSQHWVRIFVFQDDVRKVMWIFRAIVKKDNQIAKEDKLAIETAVKRFKREILAYAQDQEKSEKAKNLDILRGGKK